MSVTPTNLLFIMSDQHNRAMTGCYGHPVVQTPNLDRLAARGARFTRAYCNCPICVPSRASMATGRYVHELGAWDNAFPYVGGAPSWGHRLTERGHKVTTVGKLHYRAPGDDTGFPDQRLPMHVLDGIGDTYSLIREDMDVRPAAGEKILEARAGDSDYTRYDLAIATEAVRWLREEAQREDRPWVLFVSLVTPHHPLIAPPDFAAMYPPEEVILPAQYGVDERPRHPVLEEMRRVFATDGEFDESVVRRAVAIYYALCSFMDAQVGRVLDALEESGLGGATRVLYTSDHGDTVGEHGLWWKHTMYEGSAGVPMILAGRDVPEGEVVDANVSLVDCFPTILDAAGVPLAPEDSDLPGASLFDVVSRARELRRPVFGEYHAAGAITGFFMIRDERYKYVEYVGYPPQLFDLVEDPGELVDLAGEPRYANTVAECAAQLRRVCDPGAVHRRAVADQTDKVEAHGGEEAVRAGGYRIAYTPVPPEFQR